MGTITRGHVESCSSREGSGSTTIIQAHVPNTITEEGSVFFARRHHVHASAARSMGWTPGCTHLGGLRRSGLLAGLFGGGDLLQPLLLRLLVLRLVLHEHLQQLGSLVLVQTLGELVDAGRHLQPLYQDLRDIHTCKQC